jgi:hypothetical protein
MKFFGDWQNQKAGHDLIGGMRDDTPQSALFPSGEQISRGM